MDGGISFIVPVFNGLRYLRAFWESVLPHLRPGSEVICVDDNSSEDVRSTLPQFPDHVRVEWLRNDHSLGYAGTVNRAMALATQDYLIHLNTDLILCPEVCERLVSVPAMRSDVGIVGAKIIYPQDDTIDHVGISFTKRAKYHFFQFLPSDHPLVNKSRDVQATTGAILCFPRRVYDSLGPMDEELFNCNEEVDYCFRARSKGLKAHVNAEAVVYHWGSQSGHARFVRLAEAEAVFFGKWRDEIQTDVGRYIEEGLRHQIEARPELVSPPGHILNLSKSSADAEVIAVIDRVLSGRASAPVFDYRQLNNPNDTFFIPMLTPHSLMRHGHPFIYVVDSFKQLAPNRYWFAQRRALVGDELIVDHTGACIAASEL